MSRNKITNFSTKIIWHIIDGEFVQCVQDICGNQIRYWTNGILEGTAEFKKDGQIKMKSVVFAKKK